MIEKTGTEAFSGNESHDLTAPLKPYHATVAETQEEASAGSRVDDHADRETGPAAQRRRHHEGDIR